jgi:nickel-type superoxide dismutase maturation protease
VLTAAATAAAVAVWRSLGAFPAAAAGESMLPTIPPGAYVVATARGSVRPGAVVVIERDGREIVKRVASVDGDALTVLGDNPAGSTDSRTFGPVSRDSVRGVVRAVYWPPAAWRRL